MAPRELSILISPEIALAAIAAALAFFAQVIGAGVLGAVDADFGGWLVADRALESSGLSHGFTRAYFGLGA
jgi:hypothetical protein